MITLIQRCERAYSRRKVTSGSYVDGPREFDNRVPSESYIHMHHALTIQLISQLVISERRNPKQRQGITIEEQNDVSHFS